MFIIKDTTIEEVKCNSIFINLISEENAIAFEKKKDQPELYDIKKGLTKQDNQYYYFDNDIVRTPRAFRRMDSVFAYKIYPITDDIANKIINKKFVSIWEIFFNSFINYKTVYSMIKNYDTQLFKFTSFIEGDCLRIPYGLSPANMTEEQTIENYLSAHRLRYRNGEPLSLNLSVIREMKLKELNIC